MASRVKIMTSSKLPASVQFYDNLSEITGMIERRFSNRLIWQTLFDEKKYTGDYSHFCRLVKKEFDDKSSLQVSPKRPAKIEPKKNQIKASSASNQEKQKNNADETEEDGPLMFLDDLGASSKK